MGKRKTPTQAVQPEPLFDRIVTILEEARGNVLRAVNTGMVTAYWLIGREIVLELQGGSERAEYGRQVVDSLSERLTERYGKGFSYTNLSYFRQFYLAFADRVQILHPSGGEFPNAAKQHLSDMEIRASKGISSPPGRKLAPAEIPHPTGGQSETRRIQYPTGAKSENPPNLHLAGLESSADNDIPFQAGTELAPALIRHPTGDEFLPNFSPHLSWSHYRALMRVDDPAARDFYEREAVECGWSKVQLERQIHTAYYQRIIAHRGAEGANATNRERLPGEPLNAAEVLKSPYVLEFLGLPDKPELHESDIEQAIIDNLQAFLLELGKGFAFVARQRHIRFDEEDFYIDLVFYNYILKCFLLIDLKNGKLTHRDVGQMDGYVRLFEDRFKTPGDNPTIGLILCSDKSEAVAKYSVLSEGRQLFASQYLQYLPTEEELQLELQRERRQIERVMEERAKYFP